jgi:hypothetical protein
MTDGKWKFPTMARVARDTLMIMGSSVPSESASLIPVILFRCSGTVLSHWRKHLHNDEAAILASSNE